MEGSSGRGTFIACMFPVFEFWNVWMYLLVQKLKSKRFVNRYTLDTWGLPGTAGLVPIPHGSASGGANTGLCFSYCSTIGRERLGRGPGQEDMISSDFKGLFWFQTAVSTPHPCPPLTPTRRLWDPSTTCCKGIFLPRKSLWAWGGEGREALAGKGHHPLFPKDVIHSQMSFSEAWCHSASCPLNLGIPRLHMTQSNGTKKAEHERVGARVCPTVHICSSRSGIPSLIHSSFQLILVGPRLYSSLCARPLGQGRNKAAELLPSWYLQSSRRNRH